jgi:hypothetical protein
MKQESPLSAKGELLNKGEQRQGLVSCQWKESSAKGWWAVNGRRAAPRAGELANNQTNKKGNITKHQGLVSCQLPAARQYTI